MYYNTTNATIFLSTNIINSNVIIINLLYQTETEETFWLQLNMPICTLCSVCDAYDVDYKYIWYKSTANTILLLAMLLIVYSVADNK